MPGFEQHGSSDYDFGFNDPSAAAIAAAVGVKPTTLSLSDEPEFTAEGKNEDGQTEAFVVGNSKRAFTLNGYLIDKSAFEAGTTFDFDGRHYIITNRKRDLSNQDFQMAELTGMSYELITS